ncbi:uncharacterized protein SCODWIG_02047 [Saccharomycodes ludwigii]|uniref:Uncharacterized protein n=1 Tax=Saccharomycodes ludwigii TaxID=36035 RepID=A0A376B6G7_9ASCO|nr:uncharacterized protein SCODWIG_02047 [Saccharomycodes ludwigii]
MDAEDLETYKQDINALNEEIQLLEREKERLTKELEKEKEKLGSINKVTSKITNDHTDTVTKCENTLYNNLPELYKILKPPNDTSNTFHTHTDHNINTNNDSLLGISTEKNLQHDLLISNYPRNESFDAKNQHFPHTATIYENNTATRDEKETNNTKELQELINLEKCYRLMFGITLFPLIDPDNLLSMKNRNKTIDQLKDVTDTSSLLLVGLRLDVFNDYTQNFEAPYYLIFKKSFKDNKHWVIFKHTIPTCVVGDDENMEILKNENIGPLLSFDDIYLFGKLIYQDVYYWVQRKTFILHYCQTYNGNKLTELAYDDKGFTFLKFKYSNHDYKFEINERNIITKINNEDVTNQKKGIIDCLTYEIT